MDETYFYFILPRDEDSWSWGAAPYNLAGPAAVSAADLKLFVTQLTKDLVPVRHMGAASSSEVVAEKLREMGEGVCPLPAPNR